MMNKKGLTDAIFDEADAIILLTDDQGRIVRFNPKAEQLSGYLESEVLGEPFWELFLHPSDAKTSKENFARLHLGGISRNRENAWIMRDGSERVISWRNTVVRDESNSIEAVLSIGIDVTEAREIEQRLAFSERLNALGSLTGGVAHDFNNLLAVVMGNAELLGERIHSEEFQEECIQQIIAASKRGATLSKQLLAFARRARLEPNLVDLGEVIAQFGKMAPRVLPASIDIEISTLPQPLPIVIDRGEFDSALLNLVLNARDAMPNGGTLRISVELLDFELEVAPEYGQELGLGKYVSVTVEDSGHGMVQEMAEQAFEPFFTTKALGEGSGLGLSMVLGFAQQSGGTARIRSDLGSGTAVSMALPIDSQRVPSVLEVQKPEGTAENVRILLAEDEAAVRQTLKRQLTSAGHAVVCCPNGDEAVQVLKSGKDFDLLLTDFIMPGFVGGIMLAEEAVKRNPEIGVIILSGHPSDVTLRASSSARKWVVLQKPVPKEELLRAVSEACPLPDRPKKISAPDGPW